MKTSANAQEIFEEGLGIQMRLSAKQQIRNPEVTKYDNFYLLPGICYNLYNLQPVLCSVK